MKLSKYSIIPFLLSIVPFLWDGHISMIFNHYLSPEFFLSSHLFIIYIFIGLRHAGRSYSHYEIDMFQVKFTSGG